MTKTESYQLQMKPAIQDGDFSNGLMLIIFLIAAFVFIGIHIKNWLTIVYRCYECKSILPEKATFCDPCADDIEKKYFS